MKETHDCHPRSTSRRGHSAPLVWDLPLRLFHWSLVLLLFGSWLTQALGSRYMEWHMRIGYATGALILFRIGWGFVGPRHARFGDFLRGPRVVSRYVRAWLRGSAPPFAGHNPPGGWMIVLMLLVLAIQVASGLVNSDDALYQGPWHYAAPRALSDAAAGLHAANFKLLLVISAIHVLAIGLYRLRLGQDLLGPMVNGRKPLPVPGITDSRTWLGLLVMALAASAIWGLVASAPAPSPEDLGLF